MLCIGVTMPGVFLPRKVVRNMHKSRSVIRLIVKLVAENINDGSRQLEYYSVEETRTIYKKDASGENASWWLRSADVETNNKFTFMFHLNAATGIADATWEYGVAPAFRILD